MSSFKTPFFIAKRFFMASKKIPGKYSVTIVRIALVGISLGVCVMLLALGVVTGFKNEIKNKITGFNAHIQLLDYTSGTSNLGAAVLIDQPFYKFLPTLSGIKQVQVASFNPAVIESDEGMHGVLVKGIASDFDTTAFLPTLIKGFFNVDSLKQGVIIGQSTAKKMNLKVGDRAFINFISNADDIKTRRLKVMGIYKTGLDEFDNKVVITHLETLQKINKWGIEATLNLAQYGDSLYLEAGAFGGNGNYNFNWINPNYGISENSNWPVCVTESNTFVVAVSDGLNTLPDTAYLQVSTDLSTNFCKTLNELETHLLTTKGSHQYYTNGFEVFLNDINALDELEVVVYNNLPPNMKTVSVFEQFPEIFNWLEMLDVNVIIIIVLMIVVSVINMTSALLVMIIEKIKTIGILKAMGASNWQIRKIFLFQGGFITLMGLLIGNILALLIIYLQNTYGLVSLNPETYYIEKVPIAFNLSYFIWINLISFVSCFGALLIPTWLVSSFKPAKSIRFV